MPPLDCHVEVTHKIIRPLTKKVGLFSLFFNLFLFGIWNYKYRMYIRVMDMTKRPKTHYNVKNTPFYVYWGGAEIQGQCKWVIACDDDNLIDELTQHIDQLWVDKQEAQMMATDFWNQFNQTGTYKY